MACLSCCSDRECSSHKEARQQAEWRELVLKGATPIQRMAAKKRSTAVLPGAFREPGFIYMNQTIQIWNIHEYKRNPKWRDDAVRRSEKRKILNEGQQHRVLRGSRKRFRKMVDEWYRKSLGTDETSGSQDVAQSQLSP